MWSPWRSAEDIAAPDRLGGALQGMDLAQRGTELSGDHSLPVTRVAARFTPRSPGKSRRDYVWPPPAGLEQVAVGHMPGSEPVPSMAWCCGSPWRRNTSSRYGCQN